MMIIYDLWFFDARRITIDIVRSFMDRDNTFLNKSGDVIIGREEQTDSENEKKNWGDLWFHGDSSGVKEKVATKYRQL